MKQLMGYTAVALLLFACGGEDPAPKPKPETPCVGEACETPCVPEEDRELCREAGAACGELQVTDGCGEPREISCGTCDFGWSCEQNLCVEDEEPVEPEVGPCHVVPEEGVCAGFGSLLRCVVEGEEEEVVRESCAADARCVENEQGASCEPFPCLNGVTLCTAAGNLKVCNGGEFVETVCEHGCSRTSQGGVCRRAVENGVLHRGRVVYEHRHPNAELTDWAEPALEPAAGLEVYYLKDGWLSLSSGTVDAEGWFELLIPQEPQPDDVLVVRAFASLGGMGFPSVGVIDPDLPPGFYQTGMTGGQPDYWSWRFDDTRAEEHVIREAHGSGAIQIFRGILLAAGKNAALIGLDLPGLNALWGLGVDFDCGACFTIEPGTDGWIFMSGGEFRSERSDSVILHESGHYAFRTMGVTSGENGSHCLGVPAPPGQALVEGHASWYSADLRRDPKLYDKQFGSFYFWDIASRTPNTQLAPPSLENGLIQYMNESWVAAVLWDLASHVRSGSPVQRALMAKEMQAPYASGYIGTYWWDVDASCRPINPQSSGIETPILSDFLDALTCNGYPMAAASSVFSESYPYNHLEPTCK